MSDSTKYIFSMGELKRQDNSLVFRTETQHTYIPIENTKELFMMNEISINTKLLSFLSANGIIIHFFNYYGGYVGTFYPKEKYLSGKLKVLQVKKYLDNREDIALSFVNGMRNNALEFISKRREVGSEEIKNIVTDLKYNIPRMYDNISGIKNILAVEGMVWNNIYKSLNCFIDPDFISNKRVKRPPDNPLNAMISYGNSLLYAKTISQIYQTHLDQTISFLHEPSQGRFSLALDISEVFKIAIVLPVIVNMINKKMIKIDKHFHKDLNYCHLNEEGRKKFTLELEKKLDSTFEHKILKRKVSYLTAIKLDGYKLIKNILENKEFNPFFLGEMI